MFDLIATCQAKRLLDGSLRRLVEAEGNGEDTTQLLQNVLSDIAILVEAAGERLVEDDNVVRVDFGRGRKGAA